jgi:transcriptional regulator with XRE-family HTH domain
MLSHNDFVKKMLENPSVKKEYDALENEFSLFAQMIQARRLAGLSQKEIADRMGTKQAAIARLEASGGKAKHSPSLATLHRYAKAIGCHLDIKIISNKS